MIVGFGVRFRIALAGRALQVHAAFSELFLRSEFILKISHMTWCVPVKVKRGGPSSNSSVLCPKPRLDHRHMAAGHNRFVDPRIKFIL